MFCHRKFCHLQKSVDNNVTYEENFPTSKILVSFLLIWRIYYILRYEKFCKKQIGKCDQNCQKHQ